MWFAGSVQPKTGEPEVITASKARNGKAREARGLHGGAVSRKTKVGDTIQERHWASTRGGSGEKEKWINRQKGASLGEENIFRKKVMNERGGGKSRKPPLDKPGNGGRRVS